MKLRNINPIGHVDVPLLGREDEPLDQEGVGCLQPGEEFDVTEEQARQLLPQVGNYEPADDEAIALLDQLAEEARAEAEQAIADAEQPAPSATPEPDPQPAGGPAVTDPAADAPTATTTDQGSAGQPAATAEGK